MIQRQPAYERALNRAPAIREKLSGKMFATFPVKPKGMHERTYQRLLSVYEKANALSLPPRLRRLIGMTPTASRLAVPGQENGVPTALQNELQVQNRRANLGMTKGKVNA